MSKKPMRPLPLKNLKCGDKVMIYEAPESQVHPEGEAILENFIWENGRGLEKWRVRFVDDNYVAERHVLAERDAVPPTPDGPARCSRREELETFLQDLHAYVTFALDDKTRAGEICATVGHDIGVILKGDALSTPRTHGFAAKAKQLKSYGA